MGTSNDKGTHLGTSPYALSFVSRRKKKEMECQDPYGTSAKFKRRDIGVYKDFHLIDAISFDLKRKRNALFLIHKLKLVTVFLSIQHCHVWINCLSKTNISLLCNLSRLLLGKLARVSLDGLNHQHKLAFWINTYNSCLMNVRF